MYIEIIILGGWIMKVISKLILVVTIVFCLLSINSSLDQNKSGANQFAGDDGPIGKDLPPAHLMGE